MIKIHFVSPCVFSLSLLSGVTSLGPVWHFPPRQALRVDLDTKTSISEWLQPFLQLCLPSFPVCFSKVFCCTGATHKHIWKIEMCAHTYTHFKMCWRPCSSCQEERNRSAILQVSKCVCLCRCVCVFNQCLISVPFAPDSIMYDNPHVIRETRERNGCLGNITWHPICWEIFILWFIRPFICWENSVDPWRKASWQQIWRHFFEA